MQYNMFIICTNLDSFIWILAKGEAFAQRARLQADYALAKNNAPNPSLLWQAWSWFEVVPQPTNEKGHLKRGVFYFRTRMHFSLRNELRHGLVCKHPRLSLAYAPNFRLTSKRKAG